MSIHWFAASRGSAPPVGLHSTAGCADTCGVFSKAVLDHFQNPRNAGELDAATASVEVSNPVCGDILKLSVKVEQGTVAQARFLCRGCTTAIACASRLTELLGGNSMHQLREISVDDLSQSLGGLPAETIHGAHLAIDAARAIAKKLQR
jgi:nitrogen fixation NifU-like protein